MKCEASNGKPPDDMVNMIHDTSPLIEVQVVKKCKSIGSSISAIVLASIFLVSFIALLTIYSNFPPLNEEERDLLRVPKSINDVKGLATVLSHYKDQHFGSVLVGITLAYVFLQSFAIPGSLFLTILSGYLFKFPLALTLVCFCSAVGASLCYFLSCIIGRPIAMRFFNEKVNSWSQIVEDHRDNLLYFIIFLRVTPFVPNWFINLSSPLLDVPFKSFFFGTLLGVAPPSAIYINAGQTLNHLTSCHDVYSLKVIICLASIALFSISPILFKYFNLSQSFSFVKNNHDNVDKNE